MKQYPPPSAITVPAASSAQGAPAVSASPDTPAKAPVTASVPSPAPAPPAPDYPKSLNTRVSVISISQMKTVDNSTCMQMSHLLSSIFNMHIHPAHLFQKSVLLTDEGSAFPSVVEFFDWNHILDRHHFTQQIKSSWANLKNLTNSRRMSLLFWMHAQYSCTKKSCPRLEQNTPPQNRGIC